MKHSGIKEEKKAEMFKLLMEAIDKKFKLEERWTMIKERKIMLEETKLKITTNAEDAKMLTLNVDSLDADARIIMQPVRYQMLQRQKDQLTGAENEDAVEPYMEAEAAYAAVTTPP